MSWLLFFTGSQLTEYEGDITFSMGPQSSYGYIFPPYQGQIDLAIQPSSIYSLENVWTGNVQLSLLPQGQGQIEHAEIGNVLITFHTLRTIHYADYVYQGDISVALSPTSPSIHDFPPVFGSVGFGLTPGSAYTLESIYAGNVAMILLPASSHFADFPYQGDIPLILNPASIHFADFPYQGSITVAILPASGYGQDFSYVCNALLSLFPGSTVIQDFGYIGNALIILLPQSISSLAGMEDLLIFDAVILRSLLLEAKISKNRNIVTDGLLKEMSLESVISKTLNYRSCLKKDLIDRTLH